MPGSPFGLSRCPLSTRMDVLQRSVSVTCCGGGRIGSRNKDIIKVLSLQQSLWSCHTEHGGQHLALTIHTRPRRPHLRCMNKFNTFSVFLLQPDEEVLPKNNRNTNNMPFFWGHTCALILYCRCVCRLCPALHSGHSRLRTPPFGLCACPTTLSSASISPSAQSKIQELADLYLYSTLQ